MLEVATRKAAGGGRVGLENRCLLGNIRQSPKLSRHARHKSMAEGRRNAYK
jgi:hypothetical protein